MICRETHQDRHAILDKAPTNRIPLRTQGGNSNERAQSVETQTPSNQLSYEFDRAFYTFKENVRRTVPNIQTTQQKQRLRVFQPTIIDTKPRNRRSRSKADPTLTQMLSCAHEPTTKHSKAPCTCNHRTSPRAENKEPEVESDEAKPLSRQSTTPSELQKRDQYDTVNHITPVLAVAIRRNPQDKDPIVQFNGVAGRHTKISFTPFIRHVSTQTAKSNVHVEFEITDES